MSNYGRRWLALAAAAVFAACTPAAHSPAAVKPVASGFDRGMWLEDYAALRGRLEHTYANLAWFGSPEGGVDVPTLHARTLATLESATDPGAAEAAIDAFVVAFHDGHFSRLPPKLVPESAPIAKVSPPGRSFAPTLGCAALGYARTRGVAFSVRFEASPGFRLLSAGEPESFRSGMASMPGGRTLGILRIPSFRSADFVAECEQAWGEIARAQPSGVCDKGCARAISRRVMVLALTALQTRLRALVGASAVVVDLGGNGGGNDLGDWAPRAFTKSPVRSARLGVVRDPQSVKYFEEQLDDLREAQQAETSEKARDVLAQARREYERLEALTKGPAPCAMGWVWRERHAWKPLESHASCTNLLFGPMYASGVSDYLPEGALGSPKAEEAIYWPSIAHPFVGSWSGPVYVIVDERTGSAAEMAAAVFRNNEVARILGTKTAGSGCGFMYSGSEFTLPHSRLRYRIPNCVRLRADGSSEVAGVRPDIELPSYEGEGEPERAMRFLAAIARDLPAR